MIVCWTIFGIIAGYVSSRLYLTVSPSDLDLDCVTKKFVGTPQLRGEESKKNVFFTALLFPSYALSLNTLLLDRTLTLRILASSSVRSLYLTSSSSASDPPVLFLSERYWP